MTRRAPTVTVLSGGETIAVMHPEKRVFPAEGQDTVETAIRTTIVSDLYLALGDQREQGRWIVARLCQSAGAADLAWRRW